MELLACWCIYFKYFTGFSSDGALGGVLAFLFYAQPLDQKAL